MKISRFFSYFRTQSSAEFSGKPGRSIFDIHHKNVKYISLKICWRLCEKGGGKMSSLQEKTAMLLTLHSICLN